jgi:hypothetical protein
MNNLTSLQRKLVYLGAMILLLVPITWLGRPPEPAKTGRIDPASGGTLARMRAEYRLGEASMGNVDPASSTMNLLLLGFRGIATSILWMDAQDQQKNKDWASLRATTDSIIMLQPHFLKVWHFQGWNLAYNVSAEWDLVSDRYYWVKEGIKFFQNGVDRNERYPELYWYTGDSLGKKIGRADEWKQFRAFFLKDPDVARFDGKPDPQINPEAKDNYLVAKTWFRSANEILDRYHNPEHIMAEILFRSYPARAQMDYATALQRDGIFDEVTRVAWAEAFEDWTTGYGAEKFDTPIGIPIQLEVTDEYLAEIRKRDEGKTNPNEMIESWLARFQDMTNYRFWRTRAKVESEPRMADAHRELYEGERKTKEANYVEGRQLLWDGMSKLEEIVEQYTDLASDDDTIEEGMIAQLFWRDCLDVEGEAPDEEEGYPLQQMWKKNQNRIREVQEEYQRRKRQTR